MLVMSADTLKKEVLKVDVERLRCLAMNEEYDNCFECQEKLLFELLPNYYRLYY